MLAQCLASIANVGLALRQHWFNVSFLSDVPTLNQHCFNVSCLLGCNQHWPPHLSQGWANVKTIDSARLSQPSGAITVSIWHSARFVQESISLLQPFISLFSFLVPGYWVIFLSVSDTLRAMFAWHFSLYNTVTRLKQYVILWKEKGDICHLLEYL